MVDRCIRSCLTINLALKVKPVNIPVKHVYGLVGVLICSKGNHAKPARATILTEGDISSQDSASLTEEIL
jgi:hypothetical protein